VEENLEKRMLNKTLKEMKEKEKNLSERLLTLEKLRSKEERGLEKRTCLGLTVPKVPNPSSLKRCLNLEDSSMTIKKISKWLPNQSKLPQMAQSISQPLSGKTSSRDKLLTSMSSTQVSTLLNLCQRALDTWDHLKSEVSQAKCPNVLKQLHSGYLPGMKHHK
jgi:hypothetical protein